MTEKGKSKTYFSDKGQEAEALLYKIAKKTFFADWSYLNPKKQNGDEICDLLIVFGSTAIIWQLKNVKLRDDRIRKQDYSKNNKQLLGAHKFLTNLDEPLSLKNEIMGMETIDFSKITQYHLISTFFGELPAMHELFEEIKEKQLHIFTQNFTEIILKELDTISDFIDYLEKKEELISRQKNTIVVEGGEEELLAWYLSNSRTFEISEEYSSHSPLIMIGPDCWNEFKNGEMYQAKKEADRKSYFWDELIIQCRECGHESYKYAAHIMASHDRYERTSLANNFLEIIQEAKNLNPNHSKKRIATFIGRNVVYAFYSPNFMDRKPDKKSVDEIVNNLFDLTYIARGKNRQCQTAIGIAYGNFDSEFTTSFMYFHFPEWTSKNQKKMMELIEQTGFFKKEKRTERKADDFYPYY